jgi:hypothetical protein
MFSQFPASGPVGPPPQRDETEKDHIFVTKFAVTWG